MIPRAFPWPKREDDEFEDQYKPKIKPDSGPKQQQAPIDQKEQPDR